MDTESKATNRLVLIHWEPEAYEHLPSERDTYILLELVTAALTYQEVLIKDTDLILNDRLIRALQGSSQNFDVFAELIKLGLVKILLRPLDEDRAGTGLDPALYPITIRANNIRSFKERPWVLEDHRRVFYSVIDDLLRRYPQSMRSVVDFPRDSNPFAHWLGDLLEKWQDVVQVREFRGIDSEIATIFARFCREEGAWLNFLRQNNPEAIRPGDEDQRFFRSQAYRCLAVFKGKHEGFKNLIQSVYNGCYCHSEGAAGTFLDDYLVEPPSLRAYEEKQLTSQRFRGLYLSPTASTKIVITPEIGEAILKTRQSPSWAFGKLQLILTRMKDSPVGEDEAREAVKEVAHEFGRNAEPLEKGSADARNWTIGWSIIAGATGIVAAVGFQPVVMNSAWAASGLMAVAPLMLDAYRSHIRVSSVTQSIVDACRFRGSYLDVPKGIDWLGPDRSR